MQQSYGCDISALPTIYMSFQTLNGCCMGMPLFYIDGRINFSIALGSLKAKCRGSNIVDQAITMVALFRVPSLWRVI